MRLEFRRVLFPSLSDSDESERIVHNSLPTKTINIQTFLPATRYAIPKNKAMAKLGGPFGKPPIDMDFMAKKFKKRRELTPFKKKTNLIDNAISDEFEIEEEGNTFRPNSTINNLKEYISISGHEKPVKVRLTSANNLSKMESDELVPSYESENLNTNNYEELKDHMNFMLTSLQKQKANNDVKFNFTFPTTLLGTINYMGNLIIPMCEYYKEDRIQKIESDKIVFKENIEGYYKMLQTVSKKIIKINQKVFKYKKERYKINVFNIPSLLII